MAFGDPDAPGNGPGPGRGGNGGENGGFRGGDRTGSVDSPGFGDAGDPSPTGGDNYGYDPADNPGRGVNPGRGYDGPGKFDTPGGRGRDPGWDKPGGYDYGPNGDVVAKVDPVTGVPTFRLYDQAYDDWFDAQLEQMREENPIAGAIATGLANMPMGRSMRNMGRMFGQEVNYDGTPVGGHAKGEPGQSEEAMNRIEEQAAQDDDDDDDGKDEDGPKTDPADEAYKLLLTRLRRGRGTTDWQEPDYGWIYRLSGLEPPAETT